MIPEQKITGIKIGNGIFSENNQNIVGRNLYKPAIMLILGFNHSSEAGTSYDESKKNNPPFSMFMTAFRK